MENKNNNIFLGKIERSGCYVNNGKYGYFLTCQKKNYKIPEWLLPEEVTLDMAKRLIAYKQKISEEWFEKKNNETKNDQPSQSRGATSDNETSEEPVVKRLTKFIKD
jgi:topoisomerase IA-like protein